MIYWKFLKVKTFGVYHSVIIKKLVDKKGYSKVIRALNNLKVWNKEDDPDISDKADKIMDRLKKEYRPETNEEVR